MIIIVIIIIIIIIIIIKSRLLHNRPGKFQSINLLFIQGSSLSFTDFLAVRHKQVEFEGHDLMVSGQDSRSCGSDFSPG